MATWNGEPAVAISGTGLTMIIVSGRGGKIVSLVGYPDRSEAMAEMGL